MAVNVIAAILSPVCARAGACVCERVRACASGFVRGPEQLLLVNEQWCRGMCGGVQFELGAIL